MLNDYNAATLWNAPYLEPFFNRPQTLAALGRLERALADYDLVLKLDPRHAEALIDGAFLCFRMNKLALARLHIGGEARAGSACGVGVN